MYGWNAYKEESTKHISKNKKVNNKRPRLSFLFLEFSFLQ